MPISHRAHKESYINSSFTTFSKNYGKEKNRVGVSASGRYFSANQKWDSRSFLKIKKECLMVFRACYSPPDLSLIRGATTCWLPKIERSNSFYVTLHVMPTKLSNHRPQKTSSGPVHIWRDRDRSLQTVKEKMRLNVPQFLTQSLYFGL